MAGEPVTADPGHLVLLPEDAYNGPYRKTLPERGTFIALQVYKRAGISGVMVYDKAGKFVT